MVEAIPAEELAQPALTQTESQIEEMFKRGVLIPFKASCKYWDSPYFWINMFNFLIFIGKAFFVLDVNSYDVHLYKNLEQEKASQTFNICGGSFPELVSK